ncbi:MAG: hypothetical protein IT289_01335 [Oligoflexia bacterium]|nr:hypothetical protein [Oligoflexia bacterium]
MLKRATLLLVFVTSPAWARYSVFDTSDIVTKNKFTSEIQVFTGDKVGAQFLGHLDTPNSDDTQFRWEFGGGYQGLEGGIFFKWSPVPDHENQVGFSLATGISYANKDNRSSLALRAVPVVSKAFITDSWGRWTPYFSFPFGVSFNESKTEYPLHLALGTQWGDEHNENWALIFESGFNMNSISPYVSGGFALSFD